MRRAGREPTLSMSNRTRFAASGEKKLGGRRLVSRGLVALCRSSRYVLLLAAALERIERFYVDQVKA